MSSPILPARLRVGVVGAGRVGAVLAAALGAAGHEVVAATAESEVSRSRAAALLPGVPLRKPTDVARACDLLLLTVPDDMLGNVVSVLAASGALREGQLVAHTSGRHGLAVLAPAAALGARPLAVHPVDDVHRHRGRPAQARRLRLRGDRGRRRAGARRAAGHRARWPRRVGARGAIAASTTPGWRTAPTTW